MSRRKLIAPPLAVANRPCTCTEKTTTGAIACMKHRVYVPAASEGRTERPTSWSRAEEGSGETRKTEESR
jgi:hypothetical protein